MYCHKLVSLVAIDISCELDLCPQCTTCIFFWIKWAIAWLALIRHLIISIWDIKIYLLVLCSTNTFSQNLRCVFLKGTLDQTMTFWLLTSAYWVCLLAWLPWRQVRSLCFLLILYVFNCKFSFMFWSLN